MTKTQYFGLAWMLYIIAVILINIMSLLLPRPMEPLEKYMQSRIDELNNKGLI